MVGELFFFTDCNCNSTNAFDFTPDYLNEP